MRTFPGCHCQCPHPCGEPLPPHASTGDPPTWADAYQPRSAQSYFIWNTCLVLVTSSQSRLLWTPLGHPLFPDVSAADHFCLFLLSLGFGLHGGPWRWWLRINGGEIFPLIIFPKGKSLLPKTNFGASCRLIHYQPRNFPGGLLIANLPANGGDTGSIPGLGRPHMLRSSWAHVPTTKWTHALEPMSHNYWSPQTPRACASQQEKPQQCTDFIVESSSQEI